jgi:hypothetical protein
MWAILALAVAVGVAVGACSQPGSSTGQGGTGGESTNTISRTGTFGIIRDWSESTHAVPVTFAAEEQGCVACHDGRAFAMGGVTDPKSFDASSPFGPYVVATDCRACHTGQGVQILQSGETTTPTMTQPIKAGAGALCVSCHRERSPGNIKATPRFAPHPSVQAPVLLGYGGIRDGLNVGNTAKHGAVENLCVGCHMTDNADGVPTHTFAPPEDPSKICGKCHQGITDYNRKVRADYDGNGTVGGIQDEVTGLLGKLNAATAKAMNADTLNESEGRILFKSGDTTVTAPIPDKVYQAAYNWALITNDKSMGVHNPGFTVTLLQESYRQLTGSAIPNAAPYPSSAASGTPSTGSTSAPSGTPSGTGTTGTP